MKRLLVALLLLVGLADAPARLSAATYVGCEVRGVTAATLQATVDGMTTGGTIYLSAGTYGDLTISNPNITIVGEGWANTIFDGFILVENVGVTLENFWVRAPGEAFGIKLFTSGAGTPRCMLRHLFVGAADTTARNAGQGPAKGLYLDGSILTTVEHCTFAFNSESGIYINSSGLPTWSTNVNIFENCTSNLNSRYGIEAVGSGIMGPTYTGGNIEDNKLGAAYIESCTNATFRDVDFEQGAYTLTNLLDIRTSSATIENCNFSTTGVTRAFLTSTCTGVSVIRNRFTTFSGYSACAVFDERSVNCHERENVFATGGYIDNRGAITQTQFNRAFQPAIGNFYGVMWNPSLTPTAATIGNVWTNTGSVTHPTPAANHLSGWLRRVVFSGTAAAETGIKQTAASDFQFWAGDSAGNGGFHFSATFRLDAWPAHTARLFVGLVASGSVAPASVADSSGLTGDAIGLYHDAADVNVFRMLGVKAGVVTKSAFTNGAVPPQVDNSRGYKFEMIAHPNSNAIQLRLTSLDNNAVCAFGTLTSAVTKTALMAPQVEVGSAAGTYSIGISNVTVQVAR